MTVIPSIFVFKVLDVHPFQIIIIVALYTVAGNTQITLVSLIAYKCFMVCQQFNVIYDDYHDKLDILYDYIHAIRKSIKSFNNYISFYMFEFMVSYIIVCVASICHIALKATDFMLVSMLLAGLTGLLYLFLMCWICDSIPSGFQKLYNKLEDVKSGKLLNAYKQSDRLVMIQLKQISPEIGFTTFGLIQVNANTFMQSLALIISYSVIITQTNF